MKYCAVFLILVLTFLTVSCRASRNTELSLEVRNSSQREIEKIVIYSDSAEKGVRILNIVPSGLKSWYPFGIEIGSSLSLNVWWSGDKKAECSFPLSKEDEKAISSHDYLVVLVHEYRAQLLSGQNPDKAAVLKTVRLTFVK